MDNSNRDQLEARIADLLRRWGNDVASRLGDSTSAQIGLTAREIARAVLAGGGEPTAEQVVEVNSALGRLVEGKTAIRVSRAGTVGTLWMHNSSVASVRRWYDLHLDPTYKTKHPRERLIEWARTAPEYCVRETLHWAQHLFSVRSTSSEPPEPCSFCGDPATVIWDCDKRGEWHFVKMCLDCLAKVQSVVDTVEDQQVAETEEA